jgi:GGDEF domain-containing protein
MTLSAQWTVQDVTEVVTAVIRCDVERDVLLASLDQRLVAQFPSRRTPAQQIFSDVYELLRIDVLPDGTVPLHQWLTTAEYFAGPRQEAATIRAKRQIHLSKGPTPAQPKATPSSSGSTQTQGDLSSTRLIDGRLLQALHAAAFEDLSLTETRERTSVLPISDLARLLQLLRLPESESEAPVSSRELDEEDIEFLDNPNVTGDPSEHLHAGDGSATRDPRWEPASPSNGPINSDRHQLSAWERGEVAGLTPEQQVPYRFSVVYSGPSASTAAFTFRARTTSELRCAFLSKGTTSLGTHSLNHIVLDDPLVSLTHARVHRDGARYTIKPVEGAGPVHVNFVKIAAPVPLLGGSVVRMGHTTLRFVTAPTPERFSKVLDEELAQFERLEPLTSTLTLPGFLDVVDSSLGSIRSASSHRSSTALALLWIDGYADFIRRHAPGEADDLVLATCSLISSVARFNGKMSRLRDNTFAVWLPNLNPDYIVKLVHDIIARASSEATPLSPHASLSAGLTFLRKQDTSGKDLLKRAIRRLDKAIANGGRQLVGDRP